tara:strand:+ start:57810 stop:58250 length:441 start_codon:yes stop_codon:yes gene_type:complete
VNKNLLITACMLFSGSVLAANLPTYQYQYTVYQKNASLNEFVSIDENKGLLEPSKGNTVLSLNGVVVKTKYDAVMTTSSYVQGGKSMLSDNSVVYITTEDLLVVSLNSLACGQVEFSAKDLPLSSPMNLTSPNGCLIEFSMSINQL